jgi:hypothetical protein
VYTNETHLVELLSNKESDEEGMPDGGDLRGLLGTSDDFDV